MGFDVACLRSSSGKLLTFPVYSLTVCKINNHIKTKVCHYLSSRNDSLIARLISVVDLFRGNSVMSTGVREDSAARAPNMHEHIPTDVHLKLIVHSM